MQGNDTMTNYVLKQLQEDINDDLYVPGQVITEKEISEKFHVSKTPAREALNILCQDGILIKIPRCGYLMKTFSYQEIQNLCQFRSILECGAIKYAVLYASQEELDELAAQAPWTIDPAAEDFTRQYNQYNLRFHLSIAQFTGNPYLVSTLRSVMLKLRHELAVDGQSRLQDEVNIHIQIAKAIQNRNENLACSIASNNIEITGKRLYSLIK